MTPPPSDAREAHLVNGMLALTETLASAEPIGVRLTGLCGSTVDLMGCDRSSVFLLEDGSYRARYNVGNPPDIAKLFPSFRIGTRDPLVREVFDTGTFVLVNDVARSPLIVRATAEAARIRALVAAPLFDDVGRPMGLITAEFNENPGEFTAIQSTLVLGVAKLGAMAIVAERRRLERLELEERLEAAEMLEAIGRLAGGVAHDFNNLLTVILGSVELLRFQLSEDSPLELELTQIEEASSRGAALTRQLLAIGRQQMVEVRSLDLDPWLTAAEPLVQRAIREDVVLDIFQAGDLRAVRADPGQLDQVLLNVALNASEAMPRGGRLTIETSNAELGEEYAAAHGVAPGAYALLAVSDTGEGMDDVTQRRAFEPFFSTKTAATGSGLGLASVYGAVRQNGGHVFLYSEKGLGTVVKIYLPVDAVNEPIKDPTRGPEIVAATSLDGTGTLLVVEDDPGLLRLVRLILSGHGYEVLEAPDGHSALSIAASHEGGIDLLLSDVVVPGPSGRELAQAVRELRPSIDVLFMSGYAENSIVHHGYVDPDVALLPKPFTPRQLAQKVHDLLADRDPSPGTP